MKSSCCVDHEARHVEFIRNRQIIVISERFAFSPIPPAAAAAEDGDEELSLLFGLTNLFPAATNQTETGKLHVTTKMVGCWAAAQWWILISRLGHYRPAWYRRNSSRSLVSTQPAIIAFRLWPSIRQSVSHLGQISYL